MCAWKSLVSMTFVALLAWFTVPAIAGTLGSDIKGYGVSNSACDSSTVPQAAFENSRNYCDQTIYGGFGYKSGKLHTMCQYTKLGGACTNVCQFGLTQAQKQVILDKHNELRRKVAKGLESQSIDGKPQPSSTNMQKMVWDDELEAIAMRWTAQCKVGHDDVRGTEGLQYVGQNGYFAGSSRFNPNFNPDVAATSWYSEVSKFSSSNINPFKFESGTGHYTQLVWAKSTKLGCGLIQFKAPDGFFKTNIFCNYGPGGNMLGDSMYNVGKTASGCTKAEDGLCI